MGNRMYQVSTLQALALGYSKSVITAGGLIREGDTGLGTFEDVNGEMIVMDGHCYRPDHSGNSQIYINIPKEAASDTYSLKQDLQEEIKSVE